MGVGGGDWRWRREEMVRHDTGCVDVRFLGKEGETETETDRQSETDSQTV